ncbi:hypothetical protein AVEN_175367-1 [Araneus ventricosus]|uniref:Endonuclease/exonuclease/phosphatase domain-containing protein n=1 Tax=Araneus ventricosus TaxID=182803 RepID=A0A4Y2RBK7_ARAVE|nr:hypothetical protein AVEN_175367-1 [Araneus ventricosus]
MHQIDLIIAQEPYTKDNQVKGIPQKYRIWTSENGKAAIISPCSHTVLSLTPLDNIIAIKIDLNQRSCTIISAYLSPLEDYIMDADLNSLNKTKASGFNGLDNTIVQQIQIANPELLPLILNRCLKFGLFPSTFKVGLV